MRSGGSAGLGLRASCHLIMTMSLSLVCMPARLWRNKNKDVEEAEERTAENKFEPAGQINKNNSTNSADSSDSSDSVEFILPTSKSS